MGKQIEAIKSIYQSQYIYVYIVYVCVCVGVCVYRVKERHMIRDEIL